MENEPKVLLDSALVPDADADAEMGGAARSIADADLAGSRFLVVCLGAEATEDGGGLVKLACTFQPAHGTRFRAARVAFKLVTPQGVRFLDIAPQEIRDEDPVKIKVNRGGTLGLTRKEVAEVGVTRGSEKEYEVYTCAVRGSGAGTATAVWTFEENEHTRAGLGTAQTLAITVPVSGKILGTVAVSATLTRPGLLGGLDAVRDMVLGPRGEERHFPLTLEIPDAATG
ncbi:MAG TPA: hypothetical protein VE913_14415 [Longimicrobium sp.]|nr:hypothetical protein [Longimicrobium sp.]